MIKVIVEESKGGRDVQIDSDLENAEDLENFIKDVALGFGALLYSASKNLKMSYDNFYDISLDQLASVKDMMRVLCDECRVEDD